MTDTLAGGRYRIVRRLAAGGMGEVLLAEFVGDPQRGVAPGLVVIKRVLPGQQNRAHHQRLLREEARLALRLLHANLVETFLLEEHHDDPLLVMEFLSGRSLAQVLGAARKTGALLPLPVCLQILHEAVCGLHFAHTLQDGGRPMGLIHRDVSPANVLLTFDGRVKVIDFGVAKADDSEIRTSTGILKGKLAYMSPEHTRGDVLTPSTDLWSLGVVFWETLIADRLFSGSNAALALSEIMDKPLVAPSSRRLDVPPEVDALTMRMLNRDVKVRVQSGAELLRLIEALPQWAEAKRADLGALLVQRFPEHAATGVIEAERAARVRRPTPIASGLVEGTLARDDDEVSTLILGADEVSALLAQVRPMDEAPLPRAEPRPALADPLPEPQELRLERSPRPSGFAALDDDAVPSDPVTQPVAPVTADASERTDVSTDEQQTVQIMRRPQPSAVGPPTQPTRSNPAAMGVPGGSGAPRPGMAFDDANTVRLDEDVAKEARAQAGVPEPALFSVDRSGPRRESTRDVRRRQNASWVAVALVTFGVLSATMGGLFSLVVHPPVRPQVWACKRVDSGSDALFGAEGHKPVACSDPRRINVDKPTLYVSGKPTNVEAPLLRERLRAGGVWQRSLVPSTTRARVAAGLPAVMVLLGLLALAFGVPGLLIAGRSRAPARGGLLLVALLVGGGLLQWGGLGWPGLKAIAAAPVVDW